MVGLDSYEKINMLKMCIEIYGEMSMFKIFLVGLMILCDCREV